MEGTSASVETNDRICPATTLQRPWLCYGRAIPAVIPRHPPSLFSPHTPDLDTYPTPRAFEMPSDRNESRQAIPAV